MQQPRRFFVVGAVLGAFSLVPVVRAAARPAGEIVVGGTGAALGLMKALGEDFMRQHPSTSVRIAPSLGSGGGLKAVAAGAIQVAVSSRALTDEERARSLQAREVVRTPFVFAVQRSNALTGLTLEQIADAFAGRRASWPDGQPVRPVLRPLSDVDTQLVGAMSPALRQAMATAHQLPGKNIGITDTDSADEVERVPGSIGTSTLILINAEARALRPLAVDGVEPTIENLRRGTYPHQKAIWIVTRADAPSAARAFADHVASAQAAATVTRLGGVHLSAPAK